MEVEANISEATKVLNTLELLELIISHVPPEYISTLETVSTTWNDLIRSSPTIQQQIKCLVPDSITPEWYSPSPNTPFYDYEPSMAMHPALDPHQIQLDHRYVTLRAGIYEASPPGLLKISHKFATRPIVQELQVCHSAYLVRGQRYPQLLRTVRRENGVRIRHLLEACSELSREYRELKKALPHLLRRVPEEHGNDFVVQFQQRMSTDGMEALKGANDSAFQSGSDGWFDLKKEWPWVEGVGKIQGRCKVYIDDPSPVPFREPVVLNWQAPVKLTSIQGNS